MTKPEAGLQADRAIESRSEDGLDRGAFVTRVSEALITPTGEATELVVGVTGPWGSGKSSVLNLVEERLRSEHPSALILRFNPWLVSGRDDLVSRFLSEFAAELRRKHGLGKRNQLLTDLASYAEELTPLANLATPGAGSLARLGLRLVQRRFGKGRTLHAQKVELSRKLKKLNKPSVIVIDELDRLEDNEVQAVAQLVRSIADFPRVSYLLAYDEYRVAEALGAPAEGSVEERRRRGRSYVEKIVQLQLPLPIILPERLKELTSDALREAFVKPPVAWENEQGLARLINILVPDLVSTYRDVKRIASAFGTRVVAVGEEVNWVDLLGFSVLEIKAPDTIARIRADPEAVVSDPHWRYRLSKAGEAEKSPSERLDSLVPEHERAVGVEDLMIFLFANLADFEHRREEPDSIRRRRPLLTALRMGVLPGSFSRAQVTTFLRSSETQQRDQLQEFLLAGQIGGFLERFEEVYPSVEGLDHHGVWRTLSSFAEKRDLALPIEFDPRREFAPELCNVFYRLLRVSEPLAVAAKEITTQAISADHLHFPTELLRNQVFAHGLFGHQKAQRPCYLDARAAESISQGFAERLRRQMLQDRLLPRLLTLQPVYLISHCRLWTEECKVWLTEWVEAPDALDAFALWAYPPGHLLEAEALPVFFDVTHLKALAEEAVRSRSSTLIAYQRAAYERLLKTATAAEKLLVGESPND